MYDSEPGSQLKRLHQATHCHFWPVSTDTLIVECYNGEKKIQCCGHGLLSVASYWMKEHSTNELTLKMSDTEIKAFKENDKTWLRFQALKTTACATPHWCEKILGAKPIKAATAGNEDGYLILQYPDNFTLSAISPPGKKLELHTQRAIIVCCGAKENSVDINFRYFAPQYGVDEDIATGSAMRVLADYWSSHYASLSAIQCGSNEGYLFSRITNNLIEIGGYCRVENH